LTARFEPEKYRGEKYLKILNWWWEEDVTVTEEIKASVREGLNEFASYLGAQGIERASDLKIFDRLENF
jgi:uncharacterized protein YcaQ